MICIEEEVLILFPAYILFLLFPLWIYWGDYSSGRYSSYYYYLLHTVTYCCQLKWCDWCWLGSSSYIISTVYIIPSLSQTNLRMILPVLTIALWICWQDCSFAANWNGVIGVEEEVLTYIISSGDCCDSQWQRMVQTIDVPHKERAATTTTTTTPPTTRWYCWWRWCGQCSYQYVDIFQRRNQILWLNAITRRQDKEKEEEQRRRSSSSSNSRLTSEGGRLNSTLPFCLVVVSSSLSHSHSHYCIIDWLALCCFFFPLLFVIFLLLIFLIQ